MKYLVIVVLCSISLTVADEVLCQICDKSANLLEYYCKNVTETVPQTCSSERIPFKSFNDNETVEHLKIEGCNGKTVAAAIRSFKHLHSLDISYSNFKSLEWLNQKHLQLERFNASNNRLSDIPRDFFRQFPGLIEIDLSHNKLSGYLYFTFDSAIQLKNIHLSHNAIEDIGFEVFEHLPHLEYADLSYNKLRFGVSAFSKLKSLKTLHLANNHIPHFDCKQFFMANSVSVHINWDSVESLLLKECGDNRFRAVLNSKHNGILATAGGQFEIHCSEGSFRNIFAFISEANVENVTELLQCFGPSLAIISLDGNFVGKLNSGNFKRFENLRRLSLKNTHLSEFNFSVLKNQQNLQHLDISHNNLKQLINIRASNHLKHLTHCAAAGNRFENVSKMLNHLKSSIETLDLSDNNLYGLNASIFKRFEHLKLLNLSGTNLSILDMNPFEGHKNLTILDISKCNPENVRFVTLSATLNQLKELRVVDCNIKNLTELTQHLGGNLQVLDLSGNSLEKIETDTFKQLYNLLRLGLNDANLRHFDTSTLRQQAKLTHFAIANNKLREIDFELFAENLISIDLHGNDLAEIHNLCRKRFSNLQFLKISNNRLACEDVAELMHNFTEATFLGDPFVAAGDKPAKQKHDEDCHT